MVAANLFDGGVASRAENIDIRHVEKSFTGAFGWSILAHRCWIDAGEGEEIAA